jgi:EmrB/QacA subfamily drug resistance transporter
MTTAPPAPVHAPVSDRDRTVIYLSILLALFLAALDQTIVATALPRMVEDLEGVERYAWVATSYLLMSTALALVYGKLADTYPRKFVTLGAISLFLFGSVLCGLAGEFGDLPLLGNGMNQLVIFRGIQGAGGGGLFAMTFIVIADLFTPAERGKYQGFVGAVFGVASVLGPLIGGLLTDNAGGWIPGIEGWRWVFYVNVPIGGVAVWFITRRMPRLEPHAAQARPDLLGAALLLGGLIPLILSLQIDKRAYPWLPGLSPGADPTAFASWLTLALFLGGCALLALFVMRSRTSRGPILDPRLFRDPVFRRANASTFFVGAAFMSVTIFLPLFLVNVVGVSATRAGAALIPFSLGIVFSATLAGQIVAKVGYRNQIVLGAVVFFVAALLLAGMGSDVAYWQITLYMVMCGLGVGPGMPLFTLAIQNAADVRLIGQATSASQFFRQTGATVGAAIMGTVLGVTLVSSFAQIGDEVGPLTNGAVMVDEYVSTGGSELPELIIASFEARAGRSGSAQEARALRADGEALAEQVGASVRDAFTAATQRIYLLTAIMIAIGGGLAMRIPELPLRTTHDRAAATANPEST